MEKGYCSIPHCGTIVLARGLCGKHYNRWNKYGDAYKTKKMVSGSLADRLWARVDKSGDCWVWTGYCNTYGYGNFTYQYKPFFAHRVSYELSYGAIPGGLVIDHICHNRACVNPDHLRAVTPKQNRENLKGVTSRNTSGFLGVTWHRKKRLWMSMVNRQFVGYYPLYELHVAGYKAMMKRNELFTHNERDRIGF